ncbi:hypothetical protein QU39_00390, partial [Staphylococcus aureus]
MKPWPGPMRVGRDVAIDDPAALADAARIEAGAIHCQLLARFEPLAVQAIEDGVAPQGLEPRVCQPALAAHAAQPHADPHEPANVCQRRTSVLERHPHDIALERAEGRLGLPGNDSCRGTLD